jgi:hypothetical protein
VSVSVLEEEGEDALVEEDILLGEGSGGDGGGW